MAPRPQPTVVARVYVGDGNSLELVSLHVSVTIEGPRARTVVDHVFRNPHDRQLEGTFEYPLPTGASPSYFAMFLGQTRDTMPVRLWASRRQCPLPAEALAQMTPEQLVKHVDTADWGRLQEGRIVSKEKALETYEDVVRGRIDPALLEYAGGNTFRGRVFPIPAKGYNRVILAYEELLPIAQEHMIYRFPLPGCKLNEMQLSLQVPAAECVRPTLTLPNKESNSSFKSERGASAPRVSARGLTPPARGILIVLLSCRVRSAGDGSPLPTPGRTANRRAKPCSPARRLTLKCKPSADGRATTGPVTSMLGCGRP